MKSILKLITATFIALAPITAVAQSNVAHINVQQLVQEMPEVIAAQNELQKLGKDYETQIGNAYKEFQSKQQLYASEAQNQGDIVNEARFKELESMETNLQEFQQSASQELQKKEMDLMTPLLEKARDAILKVGKEQGFDYVIDSGPNRGVILADGKDLLADVKIELGF
jgi:outer membrane protein